MKNHQVLLIIIACLICIQVKSQQLPLFTQYREMQGMLNPAAVNPDYLLYGQPTTIGLTARAQWAKTAEGPKTQLLHGEHLIERERGALLPGLSLINDRAGMTGFTGLYGRFATVVSGDPYEGGLALGLQAGLVQYRVDLREARLHDPGDIKASTSYAQWFPDVGAGVYYYKRLKKSRNRNDLFWTGISIPQVLGLELRYRENGEDFRTQRVRHLYGNAGYIHALQDEGSFLELSSWLKYVPGAPLHVDLNFRYQVNNTFWLGAGGSSSKALHTEFGLRLDGFPAENQSLRIGYGFDYWFARFGPQMGGTHELNVALGFGGR